MSRRPQVVVALLTPFAAGGTLDEGALAEHVDFLVEAGVDGLMPCGTTGEGPLLEQDEIDGIIHATIDAAAGRVPVIAHVGRPSTQRTVFLAKLALERGAAGISAVTPYYYVPTPEQLLRHYRRLITAAQGSPVYAYVIPGRTQVDVSPDAVRRLRDDGLTGIKDSTKSWERHLEYLDCGVEVFVGTDGFVVESFRAGSTGCVSALANVRPDLLCAARDGADNQDEISALREELPFSRLKAALAERLPGYPVFHRAPLT
jgi:4-hydroxy-tetrahydrodipicolinate synthase